MPKINSINNTTQDLTVDPGASGDSYVQYNIGGTAEFRIGVDDDDSDSFKISQGSALGTNDTLIINTAGQRTLPLQPLFLAGLSVNQNNLTGNGTVATVAYNNVITNVGSHYDNTTYTFTAPITGKYKFWAAVVPQALDGTSTFGRLRIVTTARTYVGPTLNIGAYRETTFNTAAISMALVSVDMTAGNTAHVDFTVDGMAGDTVDLTTGNPSHFFGGSLDV